MAVAETQLGGSRYALDQTIIRAPIDGRIVRRYANPGVGASTLNVTPMFDLEPAGQRIVRAEVSEGDEPFVKVGGGVVLVPEADQSKTYPGSVMRIAPVFGERKLQSDDPSQGTDDRVVEVVVSANDAPFLIGQRVLVKFLKGGRAGRTSRTFARRLDVPNGAPGNSWLDPGATQRGLIDFTAVWDGAKERVEGQDERFG